MEICGKWPASQPVPAGICFRSNSLQRRPPPLQDCTDPASRNRRFRGQGGVKGEGGQLVHRRVLECTDCTEMGCIEFLWLLFLLLYPSVISYQSQDFTTFNTILLLKPLPERTYPPCSDHFFLARDCCNPGQQKPELSSSLRDSAYALYWRQAE